MKAAVKTEDGPMHSCFGFAWLQERSVCTAAQSAQPWPVLYCMPRGKGLWSSWDSSSLSSFQQTHTLTHCHYSARAGGSVLLTRQSQQAHRGQAKGGGSSGAERCWRNDACCSFTPGRARLFSKAGIRFAFGYMRLDHDLLHGIS